jgi:hypothetical protein
VEVEEITDLLEEVAALVAEAVNQVHKAAQEYQVKEIQVETQTLNMVEVLAEAEKVQQVRMVLQAVKVEMVVNTPLSHKQQVQVQVITTQVAAEAEVIK